MRALIAFLLLVSFASAAEKTEKLEGVVNATLTRAGTPVARFEFTRKGNLLRIENTDNKLEPINIIDLAASKLTIFYPHNTTFVSIDLDKKPRVLGGGADPGPPHGPAAAMPTLPGSTLPPTTPDGGLAISPPPGFPTAPPMPSIPAMPTNLGAGMGMPLMPAMPSTIGQLELKKTEKTRNLQGLDCALYTSSPRGENFEVWATNDAALFPFRLIERDYLARRFAPQMIEEMWPEILREKSLFPLKATLKIERDGPERLSFKVDRIDKKKIDNDKLFAPPEGYQEIQAP